MPRREMFEAHTYYHIYNRGLHKQTLFHDQKDFQRFLWYMDLYKEQYQKEIEMVGFCLLPNHFHMVLHTLVQGYAISQFIGKTCAAYTRYYRTKYNIEKGKVYFEKRFNVKIIHDYEYLQQCLRYIENNPLNHGLVEKVEDWPFRSNSCEYPGVNIEKINIDREFG